MDRKHELLQALKKLASDLDRVPRPAEIASLGSSAEIKQVFGSYSLALIAAGLQQSKPEKKPKSRIERFIEVHKNKAELKQKIFSKYKTDLLPWVGKYEKPHKDIVTIMWRSDDHGHFVDQYCDWVFWEVAKRVKPDIIIFGGDNNDFWEVSSHMKDPSRLDDLQDEIDFVKCYFFARAREICPNAEIDWILGNHELRLFRYLAEHAPQLSSLRCLEFGNLFDLDKYKINLVARDSFLTQKDKGENYKQYFGLFAGTHGVKLGPQPAQKELLTYGKSGVSGHVHRFTNFTMRNLYGYHRWISSGAMCSLKLGEEYIPDLVDWTQGFPVIHIDRRKERVFIEYNDLTSGTACIGGIYYSRE